MTGTGSFDEEFDRHFARAYRSALRLLGDPHLAEDAASEALARALVRWKKVGNLPHRDAWIVRVAINCSIDILRRRRDQLIGELTDAPAPDPDDVLVFRSLLVSLPKRQREVIALRYVADLHDAEIAALLQISVGSVKQHGARALASLRALLLPRTPLADHGSA